MGHIESKGVTLPLDVSCYLWNIMWSLVWHLWMQHNLHIHMCRTTTESLPYLHSCYLCSLQRVDPYPTYEVLSYLLLLTCRLQWIPTPYFWSFTHVSRSPVLINIPDVFSFRLQCVLRYTWNEYTYSFSKDTSNEYTRSFCRHMNRNKSNTYSHSLTTHDSEMHIHIHTQCFLRTGCDFVSTRVCILVVFFRWHHIHSVFGGLRQTLHASLRSTLSFAPRLLIFVHTVSGASLALCHFLPRTVLCTLLTPCC